VLTESLVGAIKRWQKALHLPESGVIGPADVVVLPDTVRVSGVQARTGDPVAGPLMSVTPTAKVVTVEVEAVDVGAIKQGDQVDVTLPDTRVIKGEVSSVSATAQAAGDETQNQPPTVAVTVAPRDPAAVGTLEAAPVQVAFTAETRQAVLAVPVGALLALREGGYAVQTRNGDLVPVRTGLFAMGMVEISGDGVREGMRVVTTS